MSLVAREELLENKVFVQQLLHQLQCWLEPLGVLRDLGRRLTFLRALELIKTVIASRPNDLDTINPFFQEVLMQEVDSKVYLKLKHQVLLLAWGHAFKSVYKLLEEDLNDFVDFVVLEES